jgi:hypothetical protein
MTCETSPGTALACVPSAIPLLPLALAALGLGGAWVGGLKTFVPYKPIFVIIASGLLACGFYVVYWRRNTACLPGGSARVGLWVATILGASSVLFDYLEPYLFGSQ